MEVILLLEQVSTMKELLLLRHNLK